MYGTVTYTVIAYYQTVKYCGKPTNDIGDDVFMKINRLGASRVCN